jgi:hypothetical protein
MPDPADEPPIDSDDECACGHADYVAAIYCPIHGRRAIEPPSDSDPSQSSADHKGNGPPPIPDIPLALHAIRQEGRRVRVVAWSWWREHAEPGRDYLVLQDETYHAVMNSDAS